MARERILFLRSRKKWQGGKTQFRIEHNRAPGKCHNERYVLSKLEKP